jgi:hypothetical protein
VSESRSGEHQELLERLQAEVSERSGAAGAPTAELPFSNASEATERAPYLVGITNATDRTLSVSIAYVTSNSPDVQWLSGEMFLTPQGQQEIRSPEEGYWTPQRVQEEIGDTAPCSDSWQLG